MKCICCCCCCLFFFILILTIVVYIIYAMYKPQVPSYNIDSFAVTSFDLLPDLTLKDEISVTVKAKNPNKAIAFIYKKDNSVSVLYRGDTLCKGVIPAFKQPERNVSMIDIKLSGKSKLDSGIQDSLLKDEQAKKVPLLVVVKVPVKVVLVGFPMRQVLIKINCSIVVDSLTSGKDIKILSTKYAYDVEF